MVELREDQVREKFLLYSGESEEDAARWALCMALCAECREWVGAQAVEGAQGGLERLEALAAAEAFYQLTLVDDVLTPESVSSPELKLDMGRRGEKALRLAQEKKAACTELLRENGFYFGCVQA